MDNRDGFHRQAAPVVRVLPFVARRLRAAGLRPAPRGSAKPAPTTPRHANVSAPSPTFDGAPAALNAGGILSMPESTMKEKVKRLGPKKKTLRELFLFSGNICAYPRCESLMMNKGGVFVGEVCHIEAAAEGGPRFNPGMANEDRRRANNLILLCHEHHRVVDDVDNCSYSVQILARHEESGSRTIL